jgi:Nuclease-related domain.
MLIKERDKHDSDVESLRSLLDCQISAKQRLLIEREIKCIGSGARGEDSSAYYIDFRYRDSANWAIIHDLRLEHRGFVAQIDHLLINRLFHVYVLESKNYYHGIKISPEGEFLVWSGKTYVSIESPIEQNKRHIDLLDRVVQLPGFLPTRLGVSIYPSFYSYVMVAPNSRVDRPTNGKFDTNMVIKADTLGTAIEKRVDGVSPMEVFSSLTMLVSQETLETFARRLVRLHRPSKIDYAAKFGVNAVDTPARVHEPTVHGTTESGNGCDSKKGSTCEACGGAVDGKVVYYCRGNREKFGGKVLCRSCQQTPNIDPIVQPKFIKPKESAISTGSSATQKGACEKCGVAVDGKVVYYCRVNKAKFEGKILCRDCQKAT